MAGPFASAAIDNWRKRLSGKPKVRRLPEEGHDIQEEWYGPPIDPNNPRIPTGPQPGTPAFEQSYDPNFGSEQDYMSQNRLNLDLDLGGALKSGVSSLGNFLSGPNAGKALAAGLGAAGLYQGARKMGQAEDFRKKGLDFTLNDYKQRGPGRVAALNAITSGMPQRENLNNIFADPGNPYSKPLQRPDPPEFTPPPDVGPPVTGDPNHGGNTPVDIQSVSPGLSDAIGNTATGIDQFVRRHARRNAPVAGGPGGGQNKYPVPGAV